MEVSPVCLVVLVMEQMKHIPHVLLVLLEDMKADEFVFHVVSDISQSEHELQNVMHVV